MQRPLTLISSFVLALLILSGVAQAKSEVDIADLTAEQIYAKGKLLFNQHKYTEAKPYLDAAIESGYSGAALMRSDMAYKSLFIQTEEEHKYILTAAEMGNIIGMMRAGSSRSIGSQKAHWKRKVLPILKSQAEKGDALAMRLLSVYFFDDKSKSDYWIEKAAEAGAADAQLRLAQRYEDNYGWFLIPGKREKEIERLYKAASDAGYHPAMRDYAFRLKERGDIKEARKILDHLIAKGDAETLVILAFKGLPHPATMDSRKEYKIDPNKIPEETLIQSAAYYKSYFSSVSDEKPTSSYDVDMSYYTDLLAVLTESQKQQADKMATEYLKNHTVYFQDDLGEYEYTLDSIRTQ